MRTIEQIDREIQEYLAPYKELSEKLAKLRHERLCRAGIMSKNARKRKHMPILIENKSTARCLCHFVKGEKIFNPKCTVHIYPCNCDVFYRGKRTHKETCPNNVTP